MRSTAAGLPRASSRLTRCATGPSGVARSSITVVSLRSEKSGSRLKATTNCRGDCGTSAPSAGEVAVSAKATALAAADAPCCAPLVIHWRMTSIVDCGR